MSMENALAALVAATRASIGRKVGGRIFAEVAEGNCKSPYAVWALISTELGHDNCGPSGVNTLAVQITIWAKTIAEAVRLGDDLRESLNGTYLVPEGAPSDGKVAVIVDGFQTTQGDEFFGVIVEVSLIEPTT